MKQNRIQTIYNGEILKEKRGLTEIVCIEGKVWVTAAGCEADMILFAGDRLPVSGLRDICVQALEASRVSLSAGRVKERAKIVPLLVRAIES